MAKLETAVNNLKAVDVLEVFADALFRHVSLSEPYHQVTRCAIVVNPPSEVTRKEMLSIIPEDFYL
jgi:hypothetical protein